METDTLKSIDEDEIATTHEEFFEGLMSDLGDVIEDFRNEFTRDEFHEALSYALEYYKDIA